MPLFTNYQSDGQRPEPETGGVWIIVLGVLAALAMIGSVMFIAACDPVKTPKWPDEPVLGTPEDV